MKLAPGWLERAVREGLANQRRPTQPGGETPDMTDAEQLATLRALKGSLAPYVTGAHIVVGAPNKPSPAGHRRD